MKLSENFWLVEFTKSQTAARLGINNNPTGEHLKNLQRLIDHVLQPTRAALGPLVVNSGYRSPSLNAKVGGSVNSQHSLGEAADIECPALGNLALARWIAENVEFDQLILEAHNPSQPNSGWVHVSYREGRNRREQLTATFINGKARYARVNMKEYLV